MRTTKRAASGAPVKKCFAKEKRSFDEILEGLQAKRHVAEKMISRLGILKPSCPNIVILEVGAAQGEFLIAAGNWVIVASVSSRLIWPVITPNGCRIIWE